MANEWIKVRLEDVAEVLLGKMLDQKKNKGTYLPYLANTNVRWGEFDLADLRVMRFEAHEGDRYGLRHGDIVMCEGGEPGRCALWRDEKKGMMYQKALHRIRPYEGTDNRFLYYSLLHGGRTGAFAPFCTGTTIKHLPRQNLLRIQFKVPSLSTQRAIAHILGTLDDKIECNRRLNRTLEGIVRALFKSWFIDFDPVIDNALAAGNPIPDELADRAALRQQAAEEHAKPLSDDLRALFPAEFTHTDTMGPACAGTAGRWIPKGWTPSPVSAVIAVNPSVQLAKNTIAPFVDMKALPTDSLTVMEVGEKAYAGGAKFQNGDVLLARITPCLENGKTALVDFLDGDQVGFGSTEFIVLRRTKRTCQEYVYSLARSDAFRTHCIASMVGSSGRQRVQTACLETFYVAEPPKPVMAAFHSRTGPYITKVTTNARTMRIICRLRDTLLPKLLSGEVAVSLSAARVEE